jgi:hypothetical protein
MYINGESHLTPLGLLLLFTGRRALALFSPSALSRSSHPPLSRSLLSHCRCSYRQGACRRRLSTVSRCSQVRCFDSYQSTPPRSFSILLSWICLCLDPVLFCSDPHALYPLYSLLQPDLKYSLFPLSIHCFRE